MKPYRWLAMTLMIGVLTGCGGGGVDERKPVSQVAAEAAEMGEAELQKMIDRYEAAIAGKTKELESLKNKLKEIPLTEMTGDKAADLKSKVDEVTASLGTLKSHLAAYAKELASKQ